MSSPKCEICKKNDATLSVDGKLICLDCYIETKDCKDQISFPD
jgi:hypothetical protein